MIFIDSAVSFNLEKAIKFLVGKYEQTGHNPKPVVLHSLRMAIYLLELGYPEEIVIVALLHDLLEDSEVTAEEIEREFGVGIKNMVKAVSFDPQIVDPRENYREMFIRVKEAGQTALIVKATDLYSNSFYYHLAKDQIKFDLLLEKVKFFLELSQSIIGQEEVWQDLNKRYLNIKNYKVNV